MKQVADINNQTEVQVVQKKQELLMLLNALGDPSGESEKWNNHLQSIDLWPLSQVEKALQEYRPRYLNILYVTAAMNKSLHAFAEAISYQLKHGIDDINGIQVTQLETSSKQILENALSLHNSLPERFHETGLIHLQLLLSGIKPEQQVQKLSDLFVLFEDKDVQQAILVPDLTDIQFITLLLTGKSPNDIKKELYQQSQQAAD
jgi:hypothetical protein